MIRLTYHGETHNMKEWSELLGIPYNVVKYRHRNGEPVEECLRQNVRKYKPAPKIVCGGCSLTFKISTHAPTWGATKNYKTAV
jgi:hypothetical protein